MKRFLIISMLVAALTWVSAYAVAAVLSDETHVPVVEQTEVQGILILAELTHHPPTTLAGVYFGEILQQDQFAENYPNSFNDVRCDVVLIASETADLKLLVDDSTAELVRQAMTDDKTGRFALTSAKMILLIKMTLNEVDQITALIYTTGFEACNDIQDIRGPTLDTVCVIAIQDPEKWIPYDLLTEVQKDIANIEQGEVFQVLKMPSDVVNAYWDAHPWITQSWMPSGPSPPQYQRTEDMTGGVDIVFVL